MDVKKTVMWDRPEKHQALGGIGYNILAFWSLPFILLLVMQGSFNNSSVRSGVEIVYHVINFLAAVYIFWRYLKDSFFNVEINVKGFLVVVWKGALLILAVTVFLYYVAIYLLDEYEYAVTGAYGMLPLFEMDLFNLSGNLLAINPVLGTICTVFLGPVTVGCLYYATVFAPVGNNHPALAYFAMAAYLAIPRACNAFTYWNPEEELVLYLVQLPIHMLACRAYQKADTVWAPIAVLMVVNAIASVVLHVLWALG